MFVGPSTLLIPVSLVLIVLGSGATYALITTRDIPSKVITPAEQEPIGFSIVVKFSGSALNQGQIVAALYDNEADFVTRNTPLQRCQINLAESEEAVWKLTDVAPGTYAISAYLDGNNNLSLDKNAIGIPQEKYGFSNNARGNFGPPEFAECKFDVSKKTDLEIELR